MTVLLIVKLRWRGPDSRISLSAPLLALTELAAGDM